jgi:hypothetical protein
LRQIRPPLAPPTQGEKQSLNSEEEGGFGELGGVVAVFAVTDRTDGEYDADRGVHLTEERDGLLQVVSTGFDRKFFFRKEKLGTLLTVVDDFIGRPQTINMIRAQSQKDGLIWISPPLAPPTQEEKQTLKRMQNTGGIVHHTIGIDHSTELLFLEMMTYLRSETRPYEEHLFTRANPETRIRDIDDSTEIH